MSEDKKSLVGTICSDYETWADIYNYKGQLYCVYTETIDLEDHSETSIIVATSKDEGETWSVEKLPFQKTGVPFWCRPNFLKGNTSRLIFFCNLVENIDQSGEIYCFEYENGKWNPTIVEDVYGILSGNPIALSCGKTILPVHTVNPATKYYQQHIYLSDDMKTWSGTSFAKAGYDLGDAQIVEYKNNVIVLIREKSVSGWDLFIATSDDNGNRWSYIKKVAFKGGCKFSTCVYKDKIYLFFCRDKYCDYRKTLCIVSTDVDYLVKNQYKAQFYALTVDGIYQMFSGSEIGYTGVDSINDNLCSVNVRKSKNKHNTLVEAMIFNVAKMNQSMEKYQITTLL